MRFLLFIFLLTLVNGLSARAQEISEVERLNSRIQSIVNQLDRLDNRLTNSEGRFDSSITTLTEEVLNFGEISRTMEDLRSELLEVRRLSEELNQSSETFDRLLSRVASAETKIDSNSQDVQRAKDNSESIVWIVSIISAIASLMVIVVGLFFSKRFMDLHAEAKVATALLERLEAKP